MQEQNKSESATKVKIDFFAEYSNEDEEEKNGYIYLKNGFLGSSEFIQIIPNAMWNQEALNIVFFDGTGLMRNNMDIRHPLLGSLYHVLIQRLKKDNIQLPFRLFLIKIDRFTDGFDQATQKMKKIVTEEIIGSYPGPVSFLSASSGFCYALDVYKKLDIKINHFICIEPVVNYSKKLSPWEQNLPNIQQLLEIAINDGFAKVCMEFMDKQIIKKQSQTLPEKLTPDDYRLSPIFATEEQFARFKQVVFLLILVNKDGFFPQQLAFKNMLDAYNIKNVVHMLEYKDHTLGFFRFPEGYAREKVQRILQTKVPFLHKLFEIMLEIGKEHNLVSNL